MGKMSGVSILRVVITCALMACCLAFYAPNRPSHPVVLLDAWYNSQTHLDATGKRVYFHYKWDDEADSGYSVLGQIFRDLGAETSTLYTGPTATQLNKAQVYIIVSPDIPAKNPSPHYMNAEVRHADCGLGASRRRPHDHGERSGER